MVHFASLSVCKALVASIGILLLVITVTTCRRRCFTVVLLTITSFSIKIVTVFILYSLLLATGDGFAFKDDYSYHCDAEYLSTQEWTDIFAAIGTSKYYREKGYLVLNAIAYKLLGAHTLVARIINALVGSLIVLAVHRLLLVATENRRIALLGAALIAVDPSLTLWSSLQFKDVSLGLLTAVMLLEFIHIVKTQRLRHYFLLFLTAASIYFMRMTFVLALSVIALAWLILARPSRGKRTKVLFVLGLAGVMAWFSIGRYILSVLSPKLADVTSALNADVSHGGLVDLLAVRSVSDIPLIPLATFVRLILPFPPWRFEPGMLVFNLYLITNVFWLVLLPYTLLGAITALGERGYLGLVAMVFCASVMLVGVLYSGVGTRYMVQFLPLGYALCASGLLARNRYRRLIVFATYSALLVSAISYHIIKF